MSSSLRFCVLSLVEVAGSGFKILGFVFRVYEGFSELTVEGASEGSSIIKLGG